MTPKEAAHFARQLAADAAYLAQSTIVTPNGEVTGALIPKDHLERICQFMVGLSDALIKAIGEASDRDATLRQSMAMLEEAGRVVQMFQEVRDVR